MRFGVHCKIASVACLLLGGQALAADAPSTAEVLGKLHRSNLKEIEMGKMAQSHGQSKDVKKFGKMLATNTPAAEDAEKMPMGAEFDAAFAKSMLDGHNKDVTEAKTVQGATTDPKLKRLLNDIVPVLEKHQRTAQKLVDQGGKS